MLKPPSNVRKLNIYFSLIVSVAAMYFVYHRGQDRNWDLLNYHFFSGYSLLNGRYWHDIAASNLQSFFNPMANVIAYLSLAHLPFPVSAWAILAIQLLSVPAIVLIVREIGKGLGYPKPVVAEVVVLSLCILSPLWWSELGTTFFSSTTAPLVLWGIFLIFRDFSTRPVVRQGFGLVIAGWLFGFSAGLKLTNAPFAIAATLTVFYLSFGNDVRASLGCLIRFSVGGVLGFAITAWWNLYLWEAWGSPVYPLYNTIFKSPYFDLVNWRDMRWHFASITEFAKFIVQAAFATVKTSEITFADARLLFTSLLLPGAMLCNPLAPSGKSVAGFLFFSMVGFFLWALTLAYQRYLIPLELLWGAVIWVLVARITDRERVRLVVLLGILVCSIYLVKVPDWGHAKSEIGANNPFSIELPEKISSVPSRYIVVGVPISYILPSLHQQSIFYGVGFTQQVDNLIKDKVNEHSELPLRILARDSDAHLLWDRLNTINAAPALNNMECTYFKTGVGRYISCEVVKDRGQVLPGDLLVDAKFSEGSYLRTKGVLWDKGFGGVEPWGQWSDGTIAEIGFANCLPKGNIEIVVTGHAFGPNIGQPANFVLGSQSEKAVFGESDSDAVIKFNNQEECSNKLRIHIPASSSPKELGLSEDSRKLGIGFVRVRIYAGFFDAKKE